MTRKEALRNLEVYIKCINIKFSDDCDYVCSNCELGLEQGNQLLINETLKIAFDALQQTIAVDDYSKTGSIESCIKALELMKKYKGR